jgi:hypothetical protein
MTHTEKRTERLELVLTQTERDALVDAAARMRRTFASIVRESLEDWHATYGGGGDPR